ncbi:DUF4129 domain-containing protein [[Mycobacterium] nativiensis]|uniref:DUF4129 domain-containing protein n=1 Tax=[Mycobacterium] nativiensis TaxID=2855503 RepID=A0ABU5XS89_9MYCO|nr:DUF4129 domain-containing protein [Mycolicibacter sp. MYC340]MEB3030578.1 DUF4129 domain-containing protein [Mycolicibacter sp. MYC340]
MTGSDRTITRVIALIVLLLAAGAATRGYLPGVTHEPRRTPAAGPAEMITLIALLAVSVGAVAFAGAYRMRHRRAVAGSIGELSVTAGAHRGRPGWRVLLIVAAAVVAWLLMLFALLALGGGLRIGIPAGIFGSRGDVPVSPTAPGEQAPLTPHPAPSLDGSGGDVTGYLLASAIALVALIAVGVVAAQARNTRPRPPATRPVPIAKPTPSAGETLARAAELGLTRIADRSRGPREAIIACYAVMERHLADDPDVAPRDFDTPTEVLARAVAHHALAAGNASRLVELFTEARFSPHLMNEQHRAEAVASLRLVLDELRAST